MTDPGAQRHTGTVRRGALRQAPRRSPDVRTGRLAVVAALVLAAGVLGWLLGGAGSGSTGATRAAAGGSSSPLATGPASGPTSAGTPEPTLTPTDLRTREATPQPTVEATLQPTPQPTVEATLQPTPQPTLQPTMEATPPSAGLVIDFPQDGDLVRSRSINVIGTAPPGATVTRDIPLWFDDHATADADGLWMIPVELAEGENRLTFRLGDDAATARVILVRYRLAP